MNEENYLHSFYKEIYFHELNRKDTINARLNFPVALLTLVVGGDWYLLNNFVPTSNIYLDLPFYGLTFLAFICLVRSAVYLVRCIFGYKYSYIADTQKIDNYKSELVKYNEEIASDSKINIQGEVINLLTEQFCRCSSINSKNNFLKSTLFQNTLMWLVIATSLLALSTAPFLVVKQFYTQDKIQKVEIIN